MQESHTGFLLLDSSFKPLAANAEAVRILAFPTDPARMQRIETFLSDKVRSALITRQQRELGLVTEFKSGKRRYTCSAFRLDRAMNPRGDVLIVLLQRPLQRFVDPARFSAEYDLTSRERESVEFLIQGLTTKEIAKRMNVSPSTVSAFLRLVMVKMGTNSRSGIVGKIVQSEQQ